MTDPTREQMRALAELWSPGPGMDNELSWTLRFAADQLEKLRAGKARRDMKLQNYAVALERLRSVIENAPHGDDCWLRANSDEGVLSRHRKCTCWKADAL